MAFKRSNEIANLSVITIKFHRKKKIHWPSHRLNKYNELNMQQYRAAMLEWVNWLLKCARELLNKEVNFFGRNWFDLTPVEYAML